MKAGRRGWAAGILAAASVAAGALIAAAAGGPDEDRGPGGFLALKRFLDEAGLQVSEAPSPPGPPGTFVLLEDRRRGADAERVLQWVDAGGHLVVADPRSFLAAQAGAAPAGFAGPEAETLELQPGCADAPAAAGGISVAGSDFGLMPLSVDATGCFVSEGGAHYAVSAPRGRGRITVLGGASALTNAHLRRAGNAVFALRTVGTGGPVVFGPAVSAAAAPRGVWESMPVFAKAAAVQLGVAALLFAAVRARRFGKPVTDDVPSPIPASELVRATARLYRNSGDARFAAGRIRSFVTRRLERRLGARSDELPALLAASGADADEARRLLAGDLPAGEDALIEMAADLEALRERVEASPPA